MIRIKLATLAVGISTALLYVLWVLFGAFAWSGQHTTIFESVLPGFQWLTFGGFILGLAETFIYGLLAGLVFSLVYNAVARRATPRPASPL